MPAHLNLSLASAALVLERASQRPALLSRLRAKRIEAPAHISTDRCVESLPAQGIPLHGALDRALAAVGLAERRALADAKLTVNLGFAHCRVGILALGAMRETDDNLRRAAGAWAQTRLNLNPADHVLAWQRLPRGNRYLVSCVRQDVLDALREFARQRKIQLVSVRPAVLAGVEAVGHTHKRDGLRRDLIWTETDSHAADCVAQVFAFAGGSLQHEWRGYVRPTAEVSGWPAAGPLRRLCAVHGIQAGEVIHRRWPAGLSPSR